MLRGAVVDDNCDKSTPPDKLVGQKKYKMKIPHKIA